MFLHSIHRKVFLKYNKYSRKKVFNVRKRLALLYMLNLLIYIFTKDLLKNVFKCLFC